MSPLGVPCNRFFRGQSRASAGGSRCGGRSVCCRRVCVWCASAVCGPPVGLFCCWGAWLASGPRPRRPARRPTRHSCPLPASPAPSSMPRASEDIQAAVNDIYATLKKDADKRPYFVKCTKQERNKGEKTYAYRFTYANEGTFILYHPADYHISVVRDIKFKSQCDARPDPSRAAEGGRFVDHVPHRRLRQPGADRHQGGLSRVRLRAISGGRGPTQETSGPGRRDVRAIWGRWPTPARRSRVFTSPSALPRKGQRPARQIEENVMRILDKSGKDFSLDASPDGRHRRRSGCLAP